MKYKLLLNGAVLRYSDETYIPASLDNVDYQEYLEYSKNNEIEREQDLLLKLRIWDEIQIERTRRKSIGVKAQGHWFHSDDSSRIQQVSLKLLGNSMPPGIQWKTLSLHSPVFVEMTAELASEIFLNTIRSDAEIFATAEFHKANMEASPDPASYDYSVGWPESFEDGLTEKQKQQLKDTL